MNYLNRMRNLRWAADFHDATAAIRHAELKSSGPELAQRGALAPTSPFAPSSGYCSGYCALIVKRQMGGILKTHAVKLFLLIGSLGLAILSAAELPAAFTNSSRVLFQGDSITDMNRGRNVDPNHILGHSYAFIIGAQIGAHFPEQKLTFINRGISGNGVTDLAARWKKDTLGEKPNLLSVLIGINDVGKAFRVAKRVDVAAFEKAYDGILAEARSANPDLKIVLCEPFVTRGSATQDRLADWKADVEKLQMVVRRLSEKYHAPVVRLQKIFDDAAGRADPTYWVWDGVHPTYAGHQLLAEEWLKCVREAWPQK